MPYSNSTSLSRRKTNHLKSDGKGSLRSAVSAVWGNSALDSLIDVDMALEVEIDKGMAKREGLDITSVWLQRQDAHSAEILLQV